MRAKKKTAAAPRGLFSSASLQPPSPCLYSPRMSEYRFETYGELQPWLGREWLLTNGTGSFASSTLVGCNTRRYHGLLVAATMPPVGRVMALSRVAESVAIDNHVSPIELSINHFNQFLIPRGERYLRQVELDLTARFDFDADGVRVKKEVLLAWGRPVVGIRYTIDPGPGRTAELRLSPFVALRDFHTLLKKDGVHFELTSGSNSVGVARGGMRLNLFADAPGVQFTERPDWWYQHTYPIESERGLDDHEDLFTPGVFSLRATAPATLTLWAGLCHTSTVPGEGADCTLLDKLDFETEKKRLIEKDPAANAPQTRAQQRLFRAASQFVAKRNRPDGSAGATILAGYPWFADWGRDSMISLPGLLLSTRRFKEAGQVLSVFAGHVSEGMIPNYFNDYTNEPSYNTVDASLWFIHAAFEYLRATRERDFFEDVLMPACEAIVAGYRQGTRWGIRMDEADGLITAGDPSTQLTWMDAKIGDTAFTPRHGKAVEINALWYNALCLLGDGTLASRVRESFVKAFWISPYKGLADVLTGETQRDLSVRPNQIFAVSLPHSPLAADQQRAVVDVVRRELLTPLGLRTLATNEPGYKPRCVGGPYERDSAYHNGTIWPWLIGPYLSAYLRVSGSSGPAQAQARVWLEPLLKHMEQYACIGSITECANGDAPHTSVGAPAQAWSVAEVLRLAVELEM